MKRISIFLLALLMLVSMLLVSCGGETETSKSDVSVEESDVNTALVPHLEGKRYDNKTLKVLTIREDYNFSKLQFAPDAELQDEPVNVAAYERNNKLQSTFGFTIEAEFSEAFDPFEARVDTDYNAGTATYDVVATGIQTMAFIARNGHLLDLYDLDNSQFKFDGDWWDTAIMEDITIMNRLYFTAGDLLLMDDENTRCIFYNKGIAEDNELGNLNEYVVNKQWTIDKLHEMCLTAAREDGDGQRTVLNDDVWGLVSAAFDTFSLILGADCPQVIKDENDIPVLNMLAEHNTNVFYRVHEFMTDKNCTAWTEQYYAWNAPDAGKVMENFYINKALFLVGTISNVNSDTLRNAEIRYGILPMPLYDENQETYATTINPYHFQSVGIVGCCAPDDYEFVSAALEALAYTSKSTITPEYYDRTLKTKRFPDDDDSPEILDLIFANRLADISVIFNWNDCIQYYNQLVVKDSPDLMSHIKSKESAFKSDLEKTIAVFENS